MSHGREFAGEPVFHAVDIVCKLCGEGFDFPDETVKDDNDCGLGDDKEGNTERQAGRDTR